MKLIAKKRVKVAEGLHVMVTNHYLHTDFGVRDSQSHYSGRRYLLEWNTPGTGFFERDSESHSYHTFVRKYWERLKPNYLRLVLGKEPNFEREVQRANAALLTVTGDLPRQILESYANALVLAKSEERIQRVVRGIKDKMGNRSNKFLVSVMSHYKSKAAQLGADVRAVEVNVKNLCSPETYQAYLHLVETFTGVACCRRIWQFTDAVKDNYATVFFDLGIFDYIRSESFLPVMRDVRGGCYYILPTCIIKANSPVDFDVVPLKELTMVSQELSIEEPVEVMASGLGDAASMIKIPELNLTYYFNHVRPIVHFIEAMDQLKATL